MSTHDERFTHENAANQHSSEEDVIDGVQAEELAQRVRDLIREAAHEEERLGGEAVEDMPRGRVTVYENGEGAVWWDPEEGPEDEEDGRRRLEHISEVLREEGLQARVEPVAVWFWEEGDTGP